MTVLPPYAPLLMYAWSPPVNATLATGCEDSAQGMLVSIRHLGTFCDWSRKPCPNIVVFQTCRAAAHHLEDVCHELRDRVEPGLDHLHTAARPVPPESQIDARQAQAAIGGRSTAFSTENAWQLRRPSRCERRCAHVIIASQRPSSVGRMGEPGYSPRGTGTPGRQSSGTGPLPAAVAAGCTASACGCETGAGTTAAAAAAAGG